MPRTSKAKLPSDAAHPVPSRALEHGKRSASVKANGHHAPHEQSLDVQVLLDVLQSVRVGDFSVRLPRDQVGLAGKVADTFNEIVAANERMAQQLEQVGQVVGREGKTRKRVRFGLSLGAWGDMEASVNTLNDEFLRSANIVNTMIKQLSVFTSEVTRVAREVGTDGKLGGQAQVREVTGVWKDL